MITRRRVNMATVERLTKQTEQLMSEEMNSRMAGGKGEGTEQFKGRRGTNSGL